MQFEVKDDGIYKVLEARTTTDDDMVNFVTTEKIMDKETFIEAFKRYILEDTSSNGIHLAITKRWKE